MRNCTNDCKLLKFNAKFSNFLQNKPYRGRQWVDFGGEGVGTAKDMTRNTYKRHKKTHHDSLRPYQTPTAQGNHVWGEPIGTILGLPITTNGPPSHAWSWLQRGARAKRRRGGGRKQVNRELYPWACPIRGSPARPGSQCAMLSQPASCDRLPTRGAELHK